jgi:hypothetical protein
MTFLEPKKWPS